MKNTPETIKWDNIKAVIFDVDGTLYNHRRVRRVMAWELLKFGIFHPWNWKEIKIIYHFRKEREHKADAASDDLENQQYEWAAKAMGVPPDKVRETVHKWMYKVPLKHLYACRYDNAAELMKRLQKKGISVVVFSDYPAGDKLEAMNMSADYIFSATDAEIDRLKPDPRGLFHITHTLGLLPDECLFIGDRDERDGECARRAGMPCLIVSGDAEQVFRSLTERLGDR